MFWWDEICCFACRLMAGDDLMPWRGFQSSSRLGTLIAVFVALWLLSIFVFHVGLWIHILMALSIVVIVERFLQGPPAV